MIKKIFSVIVLTALVLSLCYLFVDYYFQIRELIRTASAVSYIGTVRTLYMQAALHAAFTLLIAGVIVYVIVTTAKKVKK